MIRYRGKMLCEDWGCPARASCALHFGRSIAYARMDGRARSVPDDDHFDRAYLGHCQHYKFDRPKVWLKILPGQITHVPKGAF